MSTLREITFSILESVKPKAAITEPITEQLIHFHVKNTRAKFIRNELNKQRSIDNEIIQDLGCLELEKVDRADCCEVQAGCIILRTKLKLPGFIELHQKNLLTRVGPIDKIKRPYQLIPYERVPFEFLNKFTKNEVKAFLMNSNDYLYIITHEDNLLRKTLKYINVQGVLENPEDASRFSTCSGNTCFSDTSQYPLKEWMIDGIKQEVIKLLFAESKQPIDSTNNAKIDSALPIENK